MAALQAVADYFGVEVCVISSYEAGEVIKIVPRGLLLTSKRVLYLSFWAEARALLLLWNIAGTIAAPGILSICKCMLVGGTMEQITCTRWIEQHASDATVHFDRRCTTTACFPRGSRQETCRTTRRWAAEGCTISSTETALRSIEV